MKLNKYNILSFRGKNLSIIFITFSIFAFIGCQSSKSSNDIVDKNISNTLDNIEPIEVDFKSTLAKNNSAAYVTSQCYTKTEDNINKTHNPCFSCHINSKEPNYINDANLQETYAFSEYTKTNKFTNLFKDRTDLVESISDSEILSYVRQNNYIKDSTITLANKLKSLPPQWDVDNDGTWNGYIPDCYFNFDDDGFDVTPDSNLSGWRAFAYYPFLGTFWPTNGSTDDVLIRLPNVFQQDESGTFDKNIYIINLAIVEALIKQKDIYIDEVDENIFGVDLNQDGELTTTNLIKFKWTKPSYNAQTKKLENFSMSYVGQAKPLLISNEYLIAPGLYPKGTEFLHSVRYIDVDENNSIKMAPRMKELRYAKKTSWNSYPQLSNASMAEIMEKDAFPERLRTILGNTETGLHTGLGWTYQGFIEDEDGELRPQNYEETQYCIGCHSGIGAIADSTFVFQRKFDYNATLKGWYHWSQDANGLKNIKEPLNKNGVYEYSFYLEQNNAGDEFRGNNEVLEKFFENDVLKDSELDILHNDISHLLLPSSERAIELNKAYYIIVKEQSFIYGRDAHVKPVENVHKELEVNKSTQLQAISLF
ncbi:MAG: hypothetical protein OQJ77_01400 [Thiovulaceae bacterium]|nr:hypothetical protein [Sulfurimonadaceae bacterium]